MESCIYEIFTSISSALVLETVKDLHYYSCHFHNLVQDLQVEGARLAETTSCIQDRVDHVKRQSGTSVGLVHSWLEQANSYINNVEKLLDQANTNKSCCFRQCPNWIWRYNLGQKLARHIEDIKKCIKESKPYIEFERATSLIGMKYFSPERCFMSKNRQYAYEQLMKVLKNDEVNTIGLYGKAGCGKTTFAIEFGRKVEEEGLFHKVVFVDMPDDMKVGRIQENIASCLSYDFPEKEERQRAQRLFKRLIQEEKVLVIMDNVRGRLDFVAIGVPSSKNHKGCKVLITTGSEEICIQNDCQEKIKLSLLDHEEAWSLFQIQALISEESSDTLKHLARKVSNECGGLLIAVTTVASTLKGKTEDEWQTALHKLRSSEQLTIGRGLPNPYDCIRLSYDNLETEAQSLFLLCAVFPEVSEIQVENLIKFAIGLGLVGDFHSFERSRYRVSVAKNKLISSCFLSDSMGGKCVKMHGIFRTVALSIAKDENKVVKCVLDRDVTVECGSIRYLWCKEFPNELDCSRIEFLCMKIDSEVPDEIFQGMGTLRVLMLCWEGLGSGLLSTTSFKLLTNLRCLFLEQWELGDISFLGYMTKLESLILIHCSFFELPNIIVTQLKHLRLLHLSECDIKMNPFEVIGRQERLEELYIDDSRPQWDLYNESTADFFNKFRVPQALKRYHIRLGAFFADYQENLLSHNRTLLLSCFDTSNPTFKNLAKKTEVLFIANIHGDAKNIIPNIFHTERGADMNDRWTEVLICDSEGIEHLVDTDKHLSLEATLLSKLRKLKIERMERLRCLYHGRRQSGLFKKLEELCVEECPQLHETLFDSLNMCCLKDLELYECPKLTSVFTPAAAQSVVHLERLEILYCDGLKHVVTDDHSREDCGLLMFPKLKFLTIRGCKKIEYMIPVTFAKGLLRLECMEIEVDPELKYLFGPCKLGANQNQNEPLVIIELPLLKMLILVKLPNIISICPRNCQAIWPSLCEFVLRDCPTFDTVSLNTCQDVSEGRQFDHNNVKIKYDDTNIRAIRVIKDYELSGIFQVVGASIDREQDLLTNCLQKLSNICNTLMQSMNLQNLEQMELSGSKEFSSNQMVMDHIGLKKLVRENYHQGDQRFNDDEDVEREHFINLHLKYENQLQDLQKSISIPQTHLVNYNSRPRPFNLCILKRLMLRSCSVLRTLFSPSSATCLISLEELLIADCHGLRYLVTCESAHHKIEEGEIILEDHDSQSYASKIFPKLKRISVMNCNSLEYILHASFSQDLVELKCIEIWKAPQLRYVFGENIDDDDHVHHSHQYQNKIQIKLPVLENIALFNVPNMINICPDSYYCTCSRLLEIIMYNVGLFTLSVKNLMVHSASTNLGCSRGSTLDAEATSHTRKQLLGSISIWYNSKIECIFHLDEFPNSERQVMNSWLIYLHLLNLPELRYIWKGTKHFVTLQNLSFLHISGCKKLKAIFSTSVLRSIPQLKILVVQQCEELEQIIEEDEENEIASYPQSTKVCFSMLKLLIVTQCSKLKRMFYISTPYEFPELEYLIVYQNPLLEEVFEESERVANVEVLLPEIKHVALVQLPNLNNISHVQGIDFEGVTNLLVHNCPKLSLTSTTIVEDMLQSPCQDKVIDVFIQCHLIHISYVINEENANNDRMLGITCQLQENHQLQLASSSKVVSLQVTSPIQSMLDSLAGSGHDEHNQIGNRIPELQEGLALERKNRAPQPMDMTLSTLTWSMEEIGTTPIGEVAASVKPTLLNFGSELSSSIHNIPSSSIEDKIKESYQEGSTSEDTTKAAVPDDSKRNDLGVTGVTHNKIGTSHCQNLKNVDDCIQKGYIDVHLDTQSSHSLVMVKLGAFKHFADLDETEIALLAEAMDVYPHLWKVLDEFSERFQTLMLKTLADMLFFLRNESAASVTAQREKEFLGLCNEAAQLGFEKSWVEEMRQRVMFRDPRVHHVQSRLNKLHQRHDQLAQELCKIKDEIDSVHNFIESQKKCFDFL